MTDIHNVVPFPPVTGDDAEKAGYAQFNKNPHLCIDIPDGGFTISTKTSEGKRVTIAFQPYTHGGSPQCVDIQYHDGDQALNCNSEPHPIFDAIGFGSQPFAPKQFGFDTRRQTKEAGENRKVSIVCVLMDNTPA